MGFKDLKLFPMEQISVTKIHGHTNTRHYVVPSYVSQASLLSRSQNFTNSSTPMCDAKISKLPQASDGSVVPMSVDTTHPLTRLMDTLEKA